MIGPPKANRDPAFTRHSIAVAFEKARATAERGSKKSHYKPLPKEFRRDGFNYRQIAREGNAAIYEQSWAGCAQPSFCYEVIRIRRREGFQIGGKLVEPYEIYPNGATWGVDGSAVPDKDSSFRKFREVVTSLSASAPFGQKRKRSRLEKSPT